MNRFDVSLQLQLIRKRLFTLITKANGRLVSFHLGLLVFNGLLRVEIVHVAVEILGGGQLLHHDTGTTRLVAVLHVQLGGLLFGRGEAAPITFVHKIAVRFLLVLLELLTFCT